MYGRRTAFLRRAWPQHGSGKPPSSSFSPSPPLRHGRRSFRSQASLESLRSPSASAAAAAHLALYNYPSFSGAFAALFARLYHSRFSLPLLVLPFSSVEPFRAEDFIDGRFESCYLLDFIGPKGFAMEISQFISRVIAFDHRQSTLLRALQLGDQNPHNLELHINTNKSSARAVHDYFSERLTEIESPSNEILGLLNEEDGDRVATVLRYIEDGDLRRWELPDTKEFNIGIRNERAKLNCVTNPHVFEQLLKIDAGDLITQGRSYISSREEAVVKLVGKPFKIRLGRGLYGECLAIRGDGNSRLSHEIGLELSRRSAAVGLRPIGAVVFMQCGILKMCLRSTDNGTDTSEIAKAYGGGGKASSSSFTIRMDEYNCWTSVNSLD